ncbi:MAG: amidohydrolase family protein, partial [Elusimicrobiota bacterium]
MTGARISLLLAGLCLAGASQGAQTPEERQADLAFTGGRVHPMGAPATVSALAVRGGKIAFIGSDEEVRAWIGPRTRVVPLKGRAVLPGFIDSHVHPIAGGIELGECPLGGADTPEELLELVRACGRRK